MTSLNDLIAQEMDRLKEICDRDAEYKLKDRGIQEELKDLLKSLALTVARVTAEAGEVEHKTNNGSEYGYDKGWNANNAERRRRLQEWLGDNV